MYHPKGDSQPLFNGQPLFKEGERGWKETERDYSNPFKHFSCSQLTF